MNNMVILIIFLECLKKMNEYYIKHDDYILGKKIRLLYRIYNQIYGFVTMEQNKVIRDSYNIQVELDTGYCTAELKGTENLSFDERLKAHKKLYKTLKAQHSNLKFLDNGVISLFSFSGGV